MARRFPISAERARRAHTFDGFAKNVWNEAEDKNTEEYLAIG